MMGFGRHYTIISDSYVAERRERHLHARLLADARLARPRQPTSQRLAGAVVSLMSRHRRHSDPAVGVGRRSATLAAAAMAVPMMGLDTDVTPVAASAPTEVRAAGSLELTDAACRLPDGRLGRIAIDRLPDEQWVAVCVASDGPRALA